MTDDCWNFVELYQIGEEDIRDYSSISVSHYHGELMKLIALSLFSLNRTARRPVPSDAVGFAVRLILF